MIAYTPSQEAKNLSEDVAKMVYEAMRWARDKVCDGTTPEWQERGNSTAQDFARSCARQIIERISASPAPVPVAADEISDEVATLVPWLLEAAIQSANKGAGDAAGKLELAAHLLTSRFPAPVPAAEPAPQPLAIPADRLPELRGTFERIVCIARTDEIRSVSHIDLADRLIRSLESFMREAGIPVADRLPVCVATELAAARAKFPDWPNDPLHALAIIGKEFGELTQAVLQLNYSPSKSSMAKIEQEAIQTAAMALRFIASLDQYVFDDGCNMHSQGN